MVTVFTYKPGNSILHTVDVRCKIISMCVLSMSVMKSDFSSLGIISIVISAMVIDTGIEPAAIIRDLKYFFILLVFVLAARALTTKGTPLVITFNIPITKQGIILGALICCRFIVVMLLGILFTGTTKPSSVKGAVQWFLSPIPMIPEKRVSTMISLFLRFMPFLIGQAKTIANTQKARCSDLQTNPVKKIFRLSVPILKKTFQSADRLATAMEARCYSENRTEPEFTGSKYDIPMYIAVFVLSMAMIFI